MSEPMAASQRGPQESTSDLISRAHQAADEIRTRAQRVDEAREIPIESIMDLHHAGLLAMAIPITQGGTEADLLTQLKVVEIIAGACASTAWCLGNHIAAVKIQQALMGGGIAPYLGAIVSEGALFSHAFLPAGTTQPVAGDYVSTGRWSFVSGSLRSRWAFLATLVPGPPPGWTPTDDTPPPASHLRRLTVELDTPGVAIEPTWQAMSLRASMSHDVILENVFVPEELAPVFRIKAPLEHVVPNSPPALTLPAGIPVHGAAQAAALLLGIANAALNDTIEYVKTASMSLGNNPRGSMPANQFAVADASMWILAGRAVLHEQAPKQPKMSLSPHKTSLEWQWPT